MKDELKDPRAYDLFGETRDKPEGSRICPICGKVLILQEKKFFTAEICPEHGAWIENGKLEKAKFKLKQKNRREQMYRKRKIDSKRESRSSSYHRHQNPFISLLIELFR